MNKKIKDFIEANRKRLNEPIMKHFLEDETNYQLLLKALLNPTFNSRKKLDDAFRNYFKKVKTVNYLSKMIYFYSIDFDKRITKQNKRNIIKEDKELANLCTAAQNVEQTRDFTFCELEDKGSISEYISNEKLFRGLKKLSDKQQQIISMKFKHNLPNKEIANKLNESEQSVSYHYKKAMKILTKHVKGE
ncbi:sigma-70 family RNA polymerase sigma factor [Bacillus sp. APMAM]|nr:sigma-70 family RNA polymerase sigma factor [Bacillus sp. APMAM]